ncbi:major facilitator superfamily domain-containing protein 6-A isoform X2 [Aethina tumida]|uniref:major facilitator superfamily domain-containing protein 6-A isoform X2 n=1 Tax=Aethina tumida TaxID=116153 RepID=UPI0021494737|nr:major facilitator superfamily domain-containing protein 6-A isoform X2 [Aethina tumida]
MLDRVNKELVPMKAHFFLWNAGTGPVVSYLSTYAKQMGFSGTTVGIIYTILPICGMVAKPLVGGIADKFLWQKKIFLFSQLLTAAAFIAILYSPTIDNNMEFTCDSGELAVNTVNVTANTNLLDQLREKVEFVECQMNCLSHPTFLKKLCKGTDNKDHCDATIADDKINIDVVLDSSSGWLVTENVFFKVVNVSVNKGDVFHPLCANLTSTSCQSTCNDVNLNMLASNSSKIENAASLYQFWVLLILMIIGWVGQAVVVSVGDAICFGMLGDKPHRYGYQRLFGALGWGIMSTIAGFIIDAMSGNSSVKDYTGAFYLGVAFLVLDFIVSSRLQYTQSNKSSSILRDVFPLLKDVRICVFLLWCIAIGMCTALVWNFLFWLIDELAEIQGITETKTIQGLTMAIQCLCGELPFFFLSGFILNRIGHVHSMSLILLVVGCRFILYSFIENPWWLLPIEVSNGLTFGLAYACMASYASIVAPAGTEATMQGMVGAIFEGVGVSLGSLMAGNLFDKYGRNTFRFFGIGALIACLVHAGVQFLLSRKDFDTKYMHPNEKATGLEDDQKELTIVN